MPRFRPLAVTFLVCTPVTASHAETQTVDLGLATLEELMAICSYCKRIRNDQNYWERVEVYVSEHTDAKFTHGHLPAVSRARESRVRSRRGDYRDASRSAVGARASSVRRTSRASSDRLNGLARNASVSRDGISSRLTSAR